MTNGEFYSMYSLLKELRSEVDSLRSQLKELSEVQADNLEAHPVLTQRSYHERLRHKTGMFRKDLAQYFNVSRLDLLKFEYQNNIQPYGLVRRPQLDEVLFLYSKFTSSKDLLQYLGLDVETMKTDSHWSYKVKICFCITPSEYYSYKSQGLADTVIVEQTPYTIATLSLWKKNILSEWEKVNGRSN